MDEEKGDDSSKAEAEGVQGKEDEMKDVTDNSVRVEGT